ncbi:catalase family peroxidase [Luteibacter flocculans]|uniref:Catalase-related peroxidase n=1 Tax=Luteibacter flocculans TaxID=2780091 RepID=A0ABY4T5F1_9GAMM|nr:catalase family peroxidase [Luteibacter flocculans]URL59975.1 catalase family peroxidase [Luteibacter flocculans]
MTGPSAHPPTRTVWRWALIGLIVAAVAAAFAYVGGWLAPKRVTPARVIDAMQANAGVYPGFRRNHAKGICVTGRFESSGALADATTADLFATGRSTPVVGRLAIPGGNPYAPDNSIPIRSFALRFDLADGEQWRTGMNAMPVFPVSTPLAFFEQQLATHPDPATGKPDPAKVKTFFAGHPETAAFLAWFKSAKPSASYVTETYRSINAFYLRDAAGQRHAVRWQVVPEQPPAGDGGTAAGDPDLLAADLAKRLGEGPLRWHLQMIFAAPDDPVDDATKAWPSDRRTVDAGTIVIDRMEAQAEGPCRDVNYDPTILPRGMEVSNDPLLAARSAAYAISYLRRTSEEGHLPGTQRAKEPQR